MPMVIHERLAQVRYIASPGQGWTGRTEGSAVSLATIRREAASIDEGAFSDRFNGQPWSAPDLDGWLKSLGWVSRIHRKKPRGKPMSPRTAGANAKRSAVRARIEHVFARQKDQMGLFIRNIGIARAEVKVGLANLVHNIDRLIFHERRAVIT